MMHYDLMLLADPGPSRAAVLELLLSAPGIRPDPDLETRFWLQTPAGEVQLNVGSKDPVESIHLEVEEARGPLLEAATERALFLADALGMRVEDVQWGAEVSRGDLSALREYWESLLAREPAVAAGAAARPWWRFW